jgi:hypothetical protein
MNTNPRTEAAIHRLQASVHASLAKSGLRVGVAAGLDRKQVMHEQCFEVSQGQGASARSGAERRHHPGGAAPGHNAQGRVERPVAAAAPASVPGAVLAAPAHHAGLQLDCRTDAVALAVFLVRIPGQDGDGLGFRSDQFCGIHAGLGLRRAADADFAVGHGAVAVRESRSSAGIRVTYRLELKDLLCGMRL